MIDSVRPGQGGEGRGRLRDIDSVERAQRLLALAWFIWVAFIGAGAGVMVGTIAGLGPFPGLLIGLGLGLAAALLFYVAWYPIVIRGMGALLGRLYAPGSTAEGPPRTYWRAEALVGRGLYGEAVEAFRDAADRNPDDPRPCLRAAAVCERELRDPAAALEWLARARRIEGLSPEASAWMTRRLAELFESLPDGAGRALTEWRRLVTLHPDSSHAGPARARIAALKRRAFGEPDVEPPPEPE